MLLFPLTPELGYKMAKKKINVRKDYSYEAKIRLPAYERPKVRRQMHFTILRGLGLVQADVMEENEAIKNFALGQHCKLKILLAQTPEAAALMIKESYTYANGVVFNAGNLDDSELLIKKQIAKMRIPVKQVKAGPSQASVYIEALKVMIAAQLEK